MAQTKIYFSPHLFMMFCSLALAFSGISQPTGLIIKDNGNVGIGTLTPTGKLEVRGETPDEGAIFILGNFDQTHQLTLFGGMQSDPNPFVLWKQGDPLRFATDESDFSEKMRITSEGRLGIGIQNPNASLHVFGDGLFRGSESGLGINPGSDYVGLSYRTQSSAYGNLYLKWAKSYFNGNLGVGISDPKQDLHVVDRIRVGHSPTYPLLYGEIIHEGNNTGFRINASAGGGWADMHFQTDGTTKMFLERAGNLGIGTTGPLTKLHIEGGSDASNGSHGYIMTGPVTSTNIIIDNNEIMARNNGTSSYLFLNNNGGGVHVGTGSPAAGYLLSVRGKIMGEELRIDNYTDWPDYVFEADYPLLSFEQLQKSIQTSGHLPGIPTAADVAKEGILVGEMQKKMLEKIEELTLYILQLHEENLALKKSIDEMKSTLNSTGEFGNQSQNQ